MNMPVRTSVGSSMVTRACPSLEARAIAGSTSRTVPVSVSGWPTPCIRTFCPGWTFSMKRSAKSARSSSSLSRMIANMGSDCADAMPPTSALRTTISPATGATTSVRDSCSFRSSICASTSASCALAASSPCTATVTRAAAEMAFDDAVSAAACDEDPWARSCCVRSLMRVASSEADLASSSCASVCAMAARADARDAASWLCCSVRVELDRRART